MLAKIKKLMQGALALNKRRPSPSVVIYKKYKSEARLVIGSRVLYWSKVCGIPFGKIAIRNQKRRWGSCSSLGNLNFNYKLSLLPPCLLDYVVIHELCHLRELNHSPRFWALVAAYYPAYEVIEREFRILERATRMQPDAIISYVKTHKCQLCLNALNEAVV